MSVSVITPIYNEEANIGRCYKNLCNQKNITFEWVVIDDGSTDSSINIMREIILLHEKDNFIITLIQQENAGAAAARENGINHSKYDVITILDADDLLSEFALASAFSKLTDSVDIVCFQVEFIDIAGRMMSRFNYKPARWPISGRQAFSYCIDGWGVAGWCMVKKKIFLDSYEYTKNIELGNSINLDELITRVNMYSAKMIDISEGTYFYCKNPSSTTNRVNKNYHSVIYTAIELDNFISDKNVFSWIVKSQRNLLSTIWCVFLRYLRWRYKLDNKSDWLCSLDMAAKKISAGVVLSDNLKLSQKVKIWIKIFVARSLRREG